MSKQEYPKYLYHETKPDLIVQSKEEHEALEDGYEETPAAFTKKSSAKAEKSKTNKDENSTEGSDSDTKKVGTPIGSIEQPEVKKTEDKKDEAKKPRKNAKIKKVE